MNDRMTTPWAEYALTRFPEDPRDQLRAWDAADTYLLRHLAESGTALSGTVVVVGDRWGALTTALSEHRPTQITDSYLTQEATRANLVRNGAATDSVRLLTTQDTPPGRIDVLLVRVPKSLALLEDQLHRLAPGVHEGTVVVGTGMVKEIHTSTLRLFERVLGPTRTSLADKKARLIFCTPLRGTARGVNPWPYRYQLPEGVGAVSGRTVTNHAGCSARTVSTSAPGSCSSICRASAAPSASWIWAAATGWWGRRSRWPTRLRRCCSPTSRTRRWPPRGRRTRRTQQAARSSGSATG